MTPPAPSSRLTAPRTRIRRIARIVRAMVLLGATVFALNAVGTWIFPDYARHIISTQNNGAFVGPLAGWPRVAYVLWDIPSLAVILVALWRLWQLFGEYQQGRIFSVRALASLRSFARWTLAAAFWSPIYRAVLSVIASWSNGPGKRELDINLSSDDYMVLLMGVALLAIASVMVEAARIAEDNEGFV